MNKQWRGIFGYLYKIESGWVYVSRDGGRTWSGSYYRNDLGLFQDGINAGYLVEVK